jgi:lysine 2,3-aminomutase
MTADHLLASIQESRQTEQWHDWRWQLQNRLQTREDLERVFTLSDSEQRALDRLGGKLPLAITPYYASLCEDRPDDPLRRTMIPVEAEFDITEGECRDPLGEEKHSPVPGIVHTYPDKVLFLVTDFCAVYCRYCTRARVVGSGELPPARSIWKSAIRYIRETPAIRDVLISGGDPLTLSDERLGWLLAELRVIEHVEIIRIGTKIPFAMPQRITPELTDILKRYHPLWFSLHVTHPRELTDEAFQACGRLADAGIPLMSQAVLLKGVNDSVDCQRELNQGLLRFRVKPYYLHQCDAIAGSEHFRTTIETGREIIRGLHGHTTGYAVPTYMVDAPGGGGKVPLTPDYVESQSGKEWHLKNYRGDSYSYREGESS